ncbi:MAG: hypothetical protein AAB358_01920 [Patescibacteria group bacterium]
MSLSALQKYILRRGLEGKKYSASKSILIKFYDSQKRRPKIDGQISIITKSVERLIKKGLIRGVGIKTAEKWFIKEIILTPLGKKKARELFGKQEKLPLMIKRSK